MIYQNANCNYKSYTTKRKIVIVEEIELQVHELHKYKNHEGEYVMLKP
jgi:hypothetical protein